MWHRMVTRRPAVHDTKVPVELRPLVCLALLAMLQTGCSTQRLLKKQHLQILKDEHAYLVDLNALLSAHPNPELQSHVSVFVSKSAIDQVLSAADNFETPIPEISGATFHVVSIRSNFRDNFPLVNLKCWAKKGNLRVDLSVFAEISTISNTKDPSKLVFKVNVIKVVPDVKIGFLKFRLWWFVRNLIHAKLNAVIATLPEFSVPLRTDFAFDAAPSSQPMEIRGDDGKITGTLDLPGYSVVGQYSLDQVLFLEDGVHVFLSTNLVKKEAK